MSEEENTSNPDRTVLVLGAGFTRAFLPKAPLLIDHYDVDPLLQKFAAFPNAHGILEQEIVNDDDGPILNIERLMTRLQGRMPYDSEQRVGPELDLLLSEIKAIFLARVKSAKQGQFHEKEMLALARYCVEHSISCITFNYDDVFDQKLHEVNPVINAGEKSTYWHPDGGYGFFCRPSLMCIEDLDLLKDTTAMNLLKLHGSINWRPIRGSLTPVGFADVFHHETWLDPHPDQSGWSETDRNAVEDHLEPDPFLVPPVLTKSAIVEEPLLRLIWSLAYKELRSADEVVFVGYSFPPTDMAARFLFREALADLETARIKVVNYDRGVAANDDLRRQYGDVFQTIDDEQFDLDGAVEWSRTFCAK